MNPATDVLWDTKGGCKSIDRARRVGENGEFCHSQVIADNGDVIWLPVSQILSARDSMLDLPGQLRGVLGSST